MDVPPEPTRAAGRRSFALYAALLSAGAVAWAAPALVASSLGAGLLADALRDEITFGLIAAQAGACLIAGLALAARTRRSPVAHRRLLTWGGGAACVFWAGTFYWWREQARAAAAGSGDFLFGAGLEEGLSAAACASPGTGAVLFALAGAWGRRGMNRTAAGGVRGEDD